MDVVLAILNTILCILFNTIELFADFFLSYLQIFASFFLSSLRSFCGLFLKKLKGSQTSRDPLADGC
jgi:hypothetical protein